jgi:hypothetical protein
MTSLGFILTQRSLTIHTLVDLATPITSSTNPTPSTKVILKMIQSQEGYAVNAAFKDGGHSVAHPYGTTEPFPSFSNPTKGPNSQRVAAHCTCMLHCRRKVCRKMNSRSLQRGRALPCCPNPRTCRELIRSRHGLRPLHLVRAPKRFKEFSPTLSQDALLSALELDALSGEDAEPILLPDESLQFLRSTCVP